MAAAASPLARFFQRKPDSPCTPAPRKGDDPRTSAGAVVSTPPRSVDARKRCPAAGATAVPVAKKARGGKKPSTPEAGGKSTDAPTADPPEQDIGDAPTADPPEQDIGGGTDEAPTVPFVESDSAERLQDLKAALHNAQRAKPGQGIPPAFTAECLHHFATGGARYDWPSWLLPDSLRDAEGHKPADPEYNPGTLWLPSEEAMKREKNHGTPMLLQYWKLKSTHFDKIALFKVGKFYETFYYDAFIVQRLCDLRWMGDKKPNVGFPEVSKHHHAKKLVEAGFKVVVVEQVERVLEKQQRDSGPKCVTREACEVYTNGTLVDPEMIGGASARYMASIHFHDRCCSFSVCLIDCATSQIQVGTLQDAADRNSLRTFLAQVQPSEVVYSAANMPSEVVMILKRAACQPQLSPFCISNSNEGMAARGTLDKYKAARPDALSEAVEAALSTESAAIATAGAISYLESALLGKRVLPFAIWDVLPSVHDPSKAMLSASVPVGAMTSRLVLDAPALSALEVLETLDGAYQGSLLDFLDNTCTQFGSRLLRQWVCAPLYDADEIRTRQEAVEFLIEHRELAQELRSGLTKIPTDLERGTSRIWGYALEAERHAVFFEDVTAKRLGEFRSLLKAYEQSLRLLTQAFPPGRALPSRLAQIGRTRGNDGCFPELQEVITRLDGSIVEDRTLANGKVKLKPQAGACAEYDQFTHAIEGAKLELEQELAGLRTRFPGVSLVFKHHPPGYIYEVEGEVKGLGQAFLQGVVETHRKGDKVRFHTAPILALIAKLEELKDKREDCIFPFLSHMFREFHAHQAPFRAAVRCLAELDSLLSLAAASQGLSGATCRPEIIELSEPSQAGTLELRSCRHPVAAAKLGAAFVPNDTLINVQAVPNVLVVTGPNMGGKSTVLRQTCIAVLMAQLGCRVNAEVCRLSPVDRIFTRIGSYDTILEGKSTLLTELEETAAVISYGSRRSLAVLDELGRGTSTFDGAAIASAVLNELSHKVGCMLLFATHYHPISREAATWPAVAPYHMAAEINEQTNEMTFLYRFLPGLCPASHGHHVARLAGLPNRVLEEALAKSTEFEGGARKEIRLAGPELLRLAEAGDAAPLHALYERIQQSLKR